MKFFKYLMSFLVLVTFFSMSSLLQAEVKEENLTESQPSVRKNISTPQKKAGLKEGFKQIGRGFKTVGKATGSGVKKGTIATGRGIKKATIATGRGIKTVGKKIKGTFSREGKNGEDVEESDLSGSGEYNSDLTENVGEEVPEAKTSTSDSAEDHEDNVN